MSHMKGGSSRKVAAHLCLTLIVKESKISVEHGRVVTTLDTLDTTYPFLCSDHGPNHTLSKFSYWLSIEWQYHFVSCKVTKIKRIEDVKRKGGDATHNVTSLEMNNVW